jgi:ankyrin repeat protein
MNESNDDLQYDASRGDISAVRGLLAVGHDSNAYNDISFPPLHHAAKNGHFEIIKLLLRKR